MLGPCQEHARAQALGALHTLQLRGGADACACAMHAGALGPLQVALGSDEQIMRQRAARMLGLILWQMPDCAPQLLQQQLVASLSTLLASDSLVGMYWQCRSDPDLDLLVKLVFNLAGTNNTCM